MENQIKFSIIIPTYNRADLIEETLSTILKQSYTNYEIIVVDNCSTDNTEKVLQPYAADNRIRYIRNEKNYERSYSRNIGLEKSSGDFATLLDSDDFMYRDCLKDAYQFVVTNPQIKVFHNLNEVVNNNREFVYRSKVPPLTNQYKALCSGNFMGAIGGFIHREVYSKFRFNLDNAMIGSEDYEFWFQIFARYKVGRINKINSGVREHELRSVHIDAYDHLIYQRDKIISIIKNDELLNQKFGKYLGRLYASYILQQVISHKAKYGFLKKMKLMLKALTKDYTILGTRRYFATLINTIK
jgi:glycosyltransferase involved in cell wall biosynthesis